MIDWNYIFWPIYPLIFAVPTIIFIPRHQYKRYFLFGFIFGGLLDVISIVLIGNLFGEFRYKAGPFMVKGIPIFAPLAFTFVWMNFFYFLPLRREFQIPYIMGFTGFSVLIGFVLENLGFFEYTHGFVRGALMTSVTFVIWFGLSARVYLHYHQEIMKNIKSYIWKLLFILLHQFRHDKVKPVLFINDRRRGNYGRLVGALFYFQWEL